MQMSCPAPSKPCLNTPIADNNQIQIAALTSPTELRASVKTQKLIVVGFMGGIVRADDLVHREALIARSLQEKYPAGVQATIYANRHGKRALQAVLRQLDVDGDGELSAAEKQSARIVIFGHSWGASQSVALARSLGALGIPVLLTIQVDSVQKQNQNDADIPPNVQEAVNFYQSEGLLHGRKRIVATDPERTTILGNHRSSYRQNAVSCKGYPLYARLFMHRHIQIENDPAVWDEIEAMIAARIA
jgi:hypothetical protein